MVGRVPFFSWRFPSRCGPGFAHNRRSSPCAVVKVNFRMRLSPLNLKILACTLDLEGHDSRAVLRACDLPDVAQIDDREWQPVAVFDRMMEAALAESMDPSFGLTAGRSPALTRYGVIAPLVMYTPHLRQALDDIARFAPLLLESPEVRVSSQGDAATMHIQPLGLREVTRRFRAETVMVGLVQMLRFIGASATDIHGVDFAYARPPYSYRYAEFFGPRVLFDQPESAIRFNAALLARAVPWHDPATYLEARARAEAALAVHGVTQDFSKALRDLILSRLPELLTVQQAAAELGTSERSLRRRLASAQTRYADLLQECQILMSQRLLSDAQCAIKQVAHDLGFHSVSGFYRAFRRWTGETPSAWRARHGLIDAEPARGPVPAPKAPPERTEITPAVDS